MKFDFSARPIHGTFSHAEIKIEGQTQERKTRLCSARAFRFPKGDRSQAECASVGSAPYSLKSWQISVVPGQKDYMQDMRRLIVVLTLAVLFAFDGAKAQEPILTSDTPAPNSSRRLFIDPSSTSVKLGKANLIVSPLAHRGNTYAGDYQLKVVPYFFKSEKGPLWLAAPPDSYRRLAQGMTIEFKGVATNQKNGKTKVVTGKITPSTSDRGKVTFSVATENGKMTFNTFYHFAP